MTIISFLATCLDGFVSFSAGKDPRLANGVTILPLSRQLGELVEKFDFSRLSERRIATKDCPISRIREPKSLIGVVITFRVRCILDIPGKQRRLFGYLVVLCTRERGVPGARLMASRHFPLLM